MPACHREVATDAVRKPNLTEIDENTRGSMANQKAVRPLEVWLSTLFIADCFVCIMGGLCLGLALEFADNATE